MAHSIPATAVNNSAYTQSAGNDASTTTELKLQSSFKPLLPHNPPKLVPGLPYTPRALCTSIALHAELALGLWIAHTVILPSHPHLLPLAILLPLGISLTLHHVLRYSALTSYDKALRAALRANAARIRCRSSSKTNSVHGGGVESTSDCAGRQGDDDGEHQDIVERCKRCGFARPERTHHCRECGRCVPRMSHHCGVLGVCIGAHNYKPFVQLVAQAALAAGLLVWHAVDVRLVARTAATYYLRLRLPPWRTILWLQVLYMQTSFALGLCALLALHARLVALNVTVVEAWTKADAWAAVVGPCRGALAAPWTWLPGRRRSRPWCPWGNTPYDGGMRVNFEEVFGNKVGEMLTPHVNVTRMVRVALRRRASLT